MASGAIDSWKVEAVRRYLGKLFPSARLDDYPRMAIAHLFTVTSTGLDRKHQERHNLLVTRQFFDRYSDGTGLTDALDSADVPRSLKKASDRTVELY